MRVRRLLAIWTAKLVSTGCKLAGKQGVTLAGKIALKIDPKILHDLAGQVREKIFVVCGTNGKTTTNNLLCSAIESDGKKLDAMVNREVYSKFKTAPTEEEREKFRQEYLDRKGMQESFRW